MTRRPTSASMVLGVALSVAFPTVLRSQTSAPNEEGIRSVLSGMDKAWNRGDAKAWAASFSPDAEYVDVAGGVLEGRHRIEAYHAQLLGGMLHGSHLTQNLIKIRFLRPEVAVVDVDAELYGYKSLPKGFPTSGAVLSARVRHVMVYVIDRWLIVASQNTYIAPPPPPE
jgi:uncharacterized protein (TIGR02246 family)